MHTIRSATKQGVPSIPFDSELKRAVRRRRRQHIDRMNEGKDKKNSPPKQQHLNKDKMGKEL